MEIAIFLRWMNILSGIYQLVSESVKRPTEDSLLVKTDKGYLPLREGVNLTGANLQGTNLQRANLAGAILRNANLKDANFRDANLKGADFTGAIIDHTDFTGANLEGVLGLKNAASPNLN